MVEIAEALDSGMDVKDITFVDGTVYKTGSLENVYDALHLPDYDALAADKREYAKSFYIQYSNTDPFSGKRLTEKYKDNLYVVQNPPAKPLSQMEMDDVYALPYMRSYHPSYEEAGGDPGHPGGEVQPDQQPRLFRRLQLLRADLPPGADHPGQKPRVHRGGGENSDEGSGFQGLHPRRGRPDGQFPFPGLRKAADQGSLPRTGSACSRSPAKICSADHHGLHRPLEKTAGSAEGEEGVHPLRHPF